MDNVQDLLGKQLELASEIHRSYRNYMKDGPSRRTEKYLLNKLDGISDFQTKFEGNHAEILASNLPGNHEYFINAESTREQIEIALEAYKDALMSLRSNEQEKSMKNPRSPTQFSEDKPIEIEDEGAAAALSHPPLPTSNGNKFNRKNDPTFLFPPIGSKPVVPPYTGTTRKILSEQKAKEKPIKINDGDLIDYSVRQGSNRIGSPRGKKIGGSETQCKPKSSYSIPPNHSESSTNENESDGESDLIRNEWMRFIMQVQKRTNVTSIASKVLLEQMYSHILKLQTELETRLNKIMRNRWGWNTLLSEYNTASNVLDTALAIISGKLDRVSSENKGNIKLPRLSLQQFNGSIREFRPFIQLFDKLIHENKDITNIEKMQYLMSHVSGEAKDAIKHLNLTGENYRTAYAILCDKYMNHRKLVLAEVKTLLNLPKTNGGVLESLKNKYYVLKDALEALKNLNIDISNWDPLINGMVLPYLDQESLQLFEQSLEAPKEVPTTEEILTFIEWRIDTLTHREKPLTAQLQKSHKNKAFYSETKKRQTKKAANKIETSSEKRDKPKAQDKGKCYKCQEARHPLWRCKQFKTLDPKERNDFIKSKCLCKVCLSHPTAKPCNSKYKCSVCQGAHAKLLHIDEATSLFLTKKNNEYCIFPTIALKFEHIQVRALLDQCANANFVTKDVADRLNLTEYPTFQTVGGIGNNSTIVKKGVYLDLSTSRYKLRIYALVIDNITKQCPEYEFEKNEEFSNLQLANPEYNFPEKVDILLSGQVYCQIMKRGMKRSRNLIAQNSQFGWIISGSIPVAGEYNRNTALVTNEELTKYFNNFFDCEEPRELNESQTCEDLYMNTTERNQEGRYVVRIPLKIELKELEDADTCVLGNSFYLARSRFYSLERKLEGNPELKKKYQDFMNTYEAMGHMSKVAQPTKDERKKVINYIPHHAVYNESSLTTKLRVVFDASMQTENKISFNDIQYTGPKVQRDITEILLAWRMFPFVFSTDVTKMYRQILIHEDQRNLQRILWRTDPTKPINEYQLNTVTYGTRSAPYLATRTMIKMSQDYEENYPLGSMCLQKYSYVDNIFGGAETIKRAQIMVKQVEQICKESAMPLHEWKCLKRHPK